MEVCLSVFFDLALEAFDAAFCCILPLPSAPSHLPYD